ncbi:hypothetical protein TNCV_45941 [Trichonephila clavipes]|nr:hypothetical protein TNCV_45941 [Trichonephila clavipes]
MLIPTSPGVATGNINPCLPKHVAHARWCTCTFFRLQCKNYLRATYPGHKPILVGENHDNSSCREDDEPDEGSGQTNAEI